MESFEQLTEQEILALAISSEDEDERTYVDFAEGLREEHPDTAHVFSDMAAEEEEHRRTHRSVFIKIWKSHTAR